MAKVTPKTKKASRPKAAKAGAIKRLKITHVSVTPDGKFELGVQTVAVRKKKPAAAATAAKPTPKAKS